MLLSLVCGFEVGCGLIAAEGMLDAYCLAIAQCD